MDDGRGRFVMLTEGSDEDLKEKYPEAKSFFRLNEIVTIKQSRFRIVDVSPFGLKLKLLREKDHG